MDEDSASTITENTDENTENFCDNQTRFALSEGFVRLFKPLIDNLDEQVRKTK